jgi:hypothetical protein
MISTDSVAPVYTTYKDPLIFFDAAGKCLVGDCTSSVTSASTIKRTFEKVSFFARGG